jgi:hypothetical protein
MFQNFGDMSQFAIAYMLEHWTKGSSLSWNYKTHKPKDSDTTSVGRVF